MPSFEVYLSRKATYSEVGMVIINATTPKEAHIKAIEGEYEEDPDWEREELMDWTDVVVEDIIDCSEP